MQEGRRELDDDGDRARVVGVGPWADEHVEPPPDDPRLDPELLREGDRRNVVDRYRYWSEAAIRVDLAERRARDWPGAELHVAVEGFQHDMNVGSVARTANAAGAAGFHVVADRRWNRRGAMATDRYLSVHHHASATELLAWARERDLVVVGLDNAPGAVPLETSDLPARCMLVIGSEGPGLSEDVLSASALLVEIAQFGSTRSMNAGAAAAVAVHAWLRRHAFGQVPPRG
ncbi:tRNA G18 (ribose-2'-O)-methylase SpoU [Quadrisphaera granulorum]|uniref:tRNA G18 (Ribose-2'-O)-methylase SpoU n=1 Tax=Quadrisphaera granulorum TaxID=317664 RepID=A0A316AF28_9ACTN|nr:TrmH family RNA methyltransferase [Quadrisphaera granulorum]PWJ55878.1 tRNA G18 (ribose-2'-O)-methylase SpoU [Quadrisphaera granulorum]SZE95375.1 tRNA G18 (ribose-2'-O)-methylase SpoU [Quadrisphaera granulorum]